MDLLPIGEGIGGIIGGIVLAVRNHKGHKTLQTELDTCERANKRLRVRLSAFETEMVTLRKLLPGGEWYVKLGLDQHPAAENPAKPDSFEEER